MRISDWSSDVCSSDLLQLQHVEVSRLASAATVDEPEQRNEAGKEPGAIAGRRRFPAGSRVVRMHQPYSRIAATLLHRQYWSPYDQDEPPSAQPGQSMGDLSGV